MHPHLDIYPKQMEISFKENTEYGGLGIFSSRMACPACTKPLVQFPALKKRKKKSQYEYL